MIERRDLQKFPFENFFIEAAIRNFMKQENEKILVEEFEKINQKLDELLSRTNEKTVDDILDLNTFVLDRKGNIQKMEQRKSGKELKQHYDEVKRKMKAAKQRQEKTMSEQFGKTMEKIPANPLKAK